MNFNLNNDIVEIDFTNEPMSDMVLLLKAVAKFDFGKLALDTLAVDQYQFDNSEDGFSLTVTANITDMRDWLKCLLDNLSHHSLKQKIWAYQHGTIQLMTILRALEYGSIPVFTVNKPSMERRKAIAAAYKTKLSKQFDFLCENFTSMRIYYGAKPAMDGSLVGNKRQSYYDHVCVSVKMVFGVLKYVVNDVSFNGDLSASAYFELHEKEKAMEHFYNRCMYAARPTMDLTNVARQDVDYDIFIWPCENQYITTEEDFKDFCFELEAYGLK